MPETLKVQLEDEEGNIYYLKTDASSVYCEDGTTVETTLNNKIEAKDINSAHVKSALINLLYPIGSIYTSIASTDPGTLFGGTWERFGKGKTIVSVDEDDTAFDTVEKTGGEKEHTLSIVEIPQHNHSVGAHSHGLNDHTHSVPSQTISGTTANNNVGHTHNINAFAVTTNTLENNVGHTHSIPPLSGTTFSSGAHSHTVNTKYSGQTNTNGSASRIIGSGTLTKNNSNAITIVKNGAHTHTLTTDASTSGYDNVGHNHSVTVSIPTKTTTTQSANHTHTFSATVAAKTTGTASGSTANSTAFNTSAAGSGGAHNNLQPYITVYMWKRTA